MSLARPVLPGRCYMVTRRCSERRFFMRPDPETTNAFVYCLAVAANRSNVQVIFFLAMSNHYHAGIRDDEGRFPEFLEYFHKLFAKHQNALRGRWENFWATEQTSVVELIGSADVVDKMVYALTNPVLGNLVERAAHWPGATSLGAQLGGAPVSVRRPRHFFRPDGPMPETATLALVRPPGLEHLCESELKDLITERITLAEATAAAERRRTGKRVLGRRAVMEQHWADRPSTVEPRRKLNPRVACKNIWRRVEVLGRNREFVCVYQHARAQAVRGLKVVFPAGTYWLRRFAGLPCEEPPLTGWAAMVA